MSSSSDEDAYLTPEELKKEVSNAEFSFLPEKSGDKYLKAYELFDKWRLSKGAKTYSETVLLSYFIELAKTMKPSTLWSTYSMIKSVIKTKRDVNISTYPKLLAFLKRKSEGYKAKKSKVFTAQEIEKFLNKAPDCDFLCVKVSKSIPDNIYFKYRYPTYLFLPVTTIFSLVEVKSCMFNTRANCFLSRAFKSLTSSVVYYMNHSLRS